VKAHPSPLVIQLLFGGLDSMVTRIYCGTVSQMEGKSLQYVMVFYKNLEFLVYFTVFSQYNLVDYVDFR